MLITVSKTVQVDYSSRGRVNHVNAPISISSLDLDLENEYTVLYNEIGLLTRAIAIVEPKNGGKTVSSELMPIKFRFRFRSYVPLPLK